MTKILQTDHAPFPLGPYSQGIVANGFIFCSGQVGVDPETKTLAADVEIQTAQIMKNLQAVLEAAGSDLEHVVKTTIFLVNIADFSKVNEVYGKFFAENKPARSTVGVSQLPQGSLPNAPLVEIEAVAVLL